MGVPRAFDVIGTAAVTVALGVALLAEWRRPLRRRVQPFPARLPANIALAALAAAVQRGAVVPAGVAVARVGERRRLGLLRWLALPRWLAVMMGFLLLDWSMYVWHRMNHRVPFLWRFHVVHHTDLDLDATTAFRFHPGEMALSVLFRCAQVAGLGVGARLLLVYDVVMQCATAFHHSNRRLSDAVERRLVRAVVTPRMHGIHHSVVEAETNANWAVVLSWWDALHGTRRLDVPAESVTIGVPAYCDPAALRLPRLLALPFARRPARP
ncbi:MAG TPA: sterol desaturase family protein [Candidatus Tectomicrobia bacterium]|nr:sterol desaturase family protein [Candidatus Tectomicrobia bacterium]